MSFLESAKIRIVQTFILNEECIGYIPVRFQSRDSLEGSQLGSQWHAVTHQ